MTGTLIVLYKGLFIHFGNVIFCRSFGLPHLFFLLIFPILITLSVMFSWNPLKLNESNETYESWPSHGSPEACLGVKFFSQNVSIQNAGWSSKNFLTKSYQIVCLYESSKNDEIGDGVTIVTSNPLTPFLASKTKFSLIAYSLSFPTVPWWA